MEHEPCVLCGSQHPPDHSSISICDGCQVSEPALTAGLRASHEIHFTTQLEPFITGITWFDLRKTAARHNGRVFQREHVHSIKPAKVVDSLSSQIQQVGRRSALTYLHLFHALGELWAQTDFGGAPVGFPSEMIKVGLGLATSSHIKHENTTRVTDFYPDPSGVYSGPATESITAERLYGADLHSLVDLLGILLQAYNDLYENFESFDPMNDLDRVRATVRRAKISASDHLDPAYSLKTMERLYSPFTLAFFDEFGFETRDARRYSDAMLQFFYHRRAMLYQALRWYQADALRAIGSYWRNRNDTSPEVFTTSALGRERRFAEKMQWAHVLDSAERLLWFDADSLRCWAGIQNRSRFDSFLDRISISIGETEFSRLSEHLNPLEKHPIVECEGQYLVPLPTHFAEAMLNTFYFDLLNMDNRIQGDQSQSWGDVIEHWAIDSIQRLFPNAAVLTSVQLGDLETDALVRYGDTLLLFEMKSKQLTKEAFQGDPDAVRADFENGIGGATSQLQRRIEYLQEQDDDELSIELGIDFRQIEQYLPIGVMSTTYGNLATTEYTRLLDSEPIPYIVSAHHLELIAQVLESPDDFVQYVCERIHASDKGFFRTDDELDFLGFYMQRGSLRPTFEAVENLVESDHDEVLNSIAGFRTEIDQHLTDNNSLVSVSWFESS
ncbi:hypothetical protein [Halomontanus rarus]|uniref:hypothetical protein n=1 Tax=Halomontanus rarus TaxID=3034020 RepID=UPI00293BC5A0|nr:hypothetical protein [Halovivax sp. KZCA124]